MYVGVCRERFNVPDSLYLTLMGKSHFRVYAENCSLVKIAVNCKFKFLGSWHLNTAFLRLNCNAHLKNVFLTCVIFS